MTIDPELLAAYADDELAGAEKARVEAAIAADPALAREVDAHRALRARLSAHFDPVAAMPVPDRLTALLQPEEAQVIDIAAARAAKERGRAMRLMSSRWAMGGALAASLVLGVMLGRGSALEGPVASKDGQLVARGELAVALNTQLASAQDGQDVRILLSFRDGQGDYCRGFEQAGTAGIACRDGADWRILRTRSGSRTNENSQYRQAGSAASEMMIAAQEMAQGQALDAQEERAARDADWQQ